MNSTESVQERGLKFTENIIFDAIRRLQPKQFDKIRFIEGDVGSDSLFVRISDKNELLENVNIIFHCAASVKLMDPLKKILNINTTGTKRLLDFAVKVKNLQAFVHISTAYSHCYQAELEERHYETQLNPDKIMKQIEELNDGELKKLQRDL